MFVRDARTNKDESTRSHKDQLELSTARGEAMKTLKHFVDVVLLSQNFSVCLLPSSVEPFFLTEN